jgi:hypothetical protein
MESPDRRNHRLVAADFYTNAKAKASALEAKLGGRMYEDWAPATG